MIALKFHHRLPVVGRPYLQRNQARLERDEARRERDQARRGQDETRRELAEARRELAIALRERDEARQKRDETLEAEEERDRSLDRPEPHFHIDQFGPNFAVGWVFGDHAPITKVFVRGDQQVIASTSSFHPRRDVAAGYPNSRFALQSGFQLTFDSPNSKGLSKLSIVCDQEGVEWLLGERLIVDLSALEQPVDEYKYKGQSSYPSTIGKCSYIIHEDSFLDIERVSALLGVYELRGTHGISDYIRYLTSCWSHFNFVAGSFPAANRNSAPGNKDFFCKANSPIEMVAIAHHLYVLKSYGVEGAFAEFGCFKGFSSSMLSLACSLLGIKMHVYDSFEGLPSSASSYYEKGEFSGSLEEVQRNIEQFGEIEPVVFHKGFFADSLKKELPPPLSCLWMDVDLDSSARDVMKAAKMLSPLGAIFSHECSPENFLGRTPRSRGGGPDDVVPAILSYYESEASPVNGLFVAGSTGAFWKAEEGIPVLPTDELRRVLQIVQA